MADETADRLPLNRGEVGKAVLDGFEVRHVGEQFLRIREVLVHVIEIAQYDVSPTDKLVEGFGFRV